MFVAKCQTGTLSLVCGDATSRCLLRNYCVLLFVLKTHMSISIKKKTTSVYPQRYHLLAHLLSLHGKPCGKRARLEQSGRPTLELFCPCTLHFLEAQELTRFGLFATFSVDAFNAHLD